eukprot:CFRG7413T1
MGSSAGHMRDFEHSGDEGGDPDRRNYNSGVKSVYREGSCTEHPTGSISLDANDPRNGTKGKKKLAILKLRQTEEKRKILAEQTRVMDELSAKIQHNAQHIQRVHETLKRQQLDMQAAEMQNMKVLHDRQTEQMRFNVYRNRNEEEALYLQQHRDVDNIRQIQTNEQGSLNQRLAREYTERQETAERERNEILRSHRMQIQHMCDRHEQEAFERVTDVQSPPPPPPPPHMPPTPMQPLPPIPNSLPSLTRGNTWGSKLLHNSYSILGKIGEGMYGSVYRAQAKQNPAEIVALKKIRTRISTEGFPLTSIREIKLLRHMTHPNVMRLIDIVTEQQNNEVLMVLEYVHHDLAGLLETGRIKFSESQAWYLMRQLLLGLQYCHNNNIMHRDLKASNLLLTPKGELKIADFGLGRNFQESKLLYTNNVVTIWYRPPELLLGEESYGPEIDMWSAGCIFGELLLGKAIFQGRGDQESMEINQLDVIMKVCGTPDITNWPTCPALKWYDRLVNLQNKYPRRLRETFEKLPKPVIEMLDHLLVLDPARRWTSSKALEMPYLVSLNNKFIQKGLPDFTKSLPRESSHEWAVKEANREKRHEERERRGGGGGNASRLMSTTRNSASASASGGFSVRAVGEKRSESASSPLGSSLAPPPSPPVHLPNATETQIQKRQQQTYVSPELIERLGSSSPLLPPSQSEINSVIDRPLHADAQSQPLTLKHKDIDMDKLRETRSKVQNKRMKQQLVPRVDNDISIQDAGKSTDSKAGSGGYTTSWHDELDSMLESNKDASTTAGNAGRCENLGNQTISPAGVSVGEGNRIRARTQSIRLTSIIDKQQRGVTMSNLSATAEFGVTTVAEGLADSVLYSKCDTLYYGVGVS